ncbi:MAG: hypothetical protein ACFFCQ_03620 [Promethearchaeota archaeon]
MTRWNSSISSPKSGDEIAPAVPRGGGTRKQQTELDIVLSDRTQFNYI